MSENGIHAVSVKLPQFWTDKAAVWFFQTEAQFAFSKITVDETKFYYVVSALDSDTVERITDLLADPPETEKYKTLKDRLIATFTPSESKRALALLNIHTSSLGDRSPLELMDKMLTLLGTNAPCFLFREIFLQQMTPEIRSHLIRSKITDCKE